jgi:hypothetical protein
MKQKKPINTLLTLFLNDRYWPKADINQTAKGESWLESQKEHRLMTAYDPKRSFRY